jgi:DNA adenine methylase
MRYFGGKAKIAKELALFLNSQLKEGQPFVDLFCGSCNVISKIDSNRVRIANDLHPQLIEMWKYAQAGGELPSVCSEEDYKEARHNVDGRFPEWYRGFVGFGCSFAGKYFGGYARGGTQNYCLSAKNSTENKLRGLSTVIFTGKSYENVLIRPSSLIYCDIPYENTTKYSVGDFNHKEFYKWAKQKTTEGHSVYVSEYLHNAREDCEIVWSKESKKDIRDKDGIQQTTIEILMRVL